MSFLKSKLSAWVGGGAGATGVTEENLFPKVDPAVDGPDCQKDCASCTVKLPASFKIDTKDKLYGNVDEWATHLLIATGKTDWVHDVTDEKGSVMEAIEKQKLEPSNGKLKLSASNIPVPDEYYDAEKGKQPTRALILPAFTWVDHVTPQLAKDLITYFVDRSPTTTSPLGLPSPEAKQENVPPAGRDPSPDVTSLTSLRSKPCQHAAVILLCSQRTRDARCGQSAPLLRKELERHLRAHGLYRDLEDERPGGVGIYFVSHVGGHKYSANMIIYRRRDFEWYKHAPQDGEQKGEGAAQGIWLARVKPEDCEGIIKYTVLQGKVIKPEYQLRGGFDRERGVVSW